MVSIQIKNQNFIEQTPQKLIKTKIIFLLISNEFDQKYFFQWLAIQIIAMQHNLNTLQ